jgi:hypothetical protein
MILGSVISNQKLSFAEPVWMLVLSFWQLQPRNQPSMNMNVKVPQWNKPRKGGNCNAPEIVI